MISEAQFQKEIDIIIANALREDVGDGDHSSLACIPKDAKGEAKLLVKEDCIIAGLDFAKQVFQHIDGNSEIDFKAKDGDALKVGDIAFTLKSNSQSILKGERLVLNAMQRMSAIATKTKAFTDVLEGTKTKILDTRKTTPGFRALEKWAVKIGGGVNHRFALYDMIMLKDNHIDFAGGVDQAIQKTQAYLKQNNLDLKIIVEARDINEIQKIIQHNGIHRILIDNFSFEDTCKAVQLIGDFCETESSGGITLSSARDYADCGVDYISSGALTHSVYNVDLSLKAI
ncbi:carboxylating nicotinate-nucleotide diphosphorylase [Psychroflexus planctonicus]|uniref:nicotinate-nucleotide diphosphorylase (carboxylating) n=1 Tax=Psychroflexus planctonicus TaxID=1526575 RepID=A0ABQ1SMK2_9FLAO|nr:carboxylating nicotinate-nucleotide diphosphorylase [Psychroflexus planctonicus]GGE43446.1 nicotinate-nucleotide diphosphorylase (carboxylating) [Psychroflexus planctonicus]